MANVNKAPQPLIRYFVEAMQHAELIAEMAPGAPPQVLGCLGSQICAVNLLHFARKDMQLRAARFAMIAFCGLALTGCADWTYAGKGTAYAGGDHTGSLMGGTAADQDEADNAQKSASVQNNPSLAGVISMPTRIGK